MWWFCERAGPRSREKGSAKKKGQKAKVQGHMQREGAAEKLGLAGKSLFLISRLTTTGKAIQLSAHVGTEDGGQTYTRMDSQ